MPVGLTAPQDLLPIAGIRLAAVSAGIRSGLGDDLVLMELTAGCRVVAVFTQNQFCAAPVIVAKEHLSIREPRFLLVNAGNANAGTGVRGLSDARESCLALADIARVGKEAIVPFSTGVIGQALPVEKIRQALPDALKQLAGNAWANAAQGIMTTDTMPKALSRQFEVPAGKVTITGIAKGSGMICPNMATTLSFIATDAQIDKKSLAALNQRLAQQSFNRISVDGDTSTNDACVLIASGRGVKLQEGTDDWQEFEQSALDIYLHLAQAIVRDGEGASKFVTLNVLGAKTEPDAEAIARTVAHSLLVKTALFASDANWGRILAAVGRAGVPLDIERVNLFINNEQILQNGDLHPDYDEAAGAAVMAQDEINIQMELGLGSAEYILWTCDLSHDYVRINAEYRT